MPLWNYPENVTSFGTLLDYTSYATNDIFGLLMLAAIFFVLTLSMKNYSLDRAFVVSSYITLIAAIFFRTMGLIGNWGLILFIILAAIGATYSYMNKSQI